MTFGENVQDHLWPEAVGPYGPFGGYGPTIMAIAWMEFTLASLLLLLRIFTRYYCQKNAGWALLWTGFSWIVGFVSQVIYSVAVHRSLNGFDNDAWTVPQALTLTWVAIYLTFIAIGIGKFAVVAFILSIQGMTYVRQRYFLYFLAGSNILIDIIAVFVLAFRCSPPHNMFILGVAESCHTNFGASKGFTFFTGAWNAATDVILAIYPLFLFHNIRIARHVKFGICFVMGLGVITSGTAIVKTWDLSHVNDTTHLSYQLYCILTWSYTEMWCVIITCSIPPLWPLARRALAGGRSTVASAKGWFGSNSGSKPVEGWPSSGGWSGRPNKRNTMTLLGNGHDPTTSSSRHLTSRGRPDSTETEVELLDNPNAQPRSTSRAVAQGGRETPASIFEDQDPRKTSHTRTKSSKDNIIGRARFDTVKTSNDSDAYEVDEPKHGVMLSRDLAKPGIVVTREYTVETERRREEGRKDDLKWSNFGNGKPMRHNWDNPNNV